MDMSTTCTPTRGVNGREMANSNSISLAYLLLDFLALIKPSLRCEEVETLLDKHFRNGDRP